MFAPSFPNYELQLKENKKSHFFILSNENQLPPAFHRMCEGSGPACTKNVK